MSCESTKYPGVDRSKCCRQLSEAVVHKNVKATFWYVSVSPVIGDKAMGNPQPWDALKMGEHSHNSPSTQSVSATRSEQPRPSRRDGTEEGRNILEDDLPILLTPNGSVWCGKDRCFCPTLNYLINLAPRNEQTKTLASSIGTLGHALPTVWTDTCARLLLVLSYTHPALNKSDCAW